MLWQAQRQEQLYFKGATPPGRRAPCVACHFNPHQFEALPSAFLRSGGQAATTLLYSCRRYHEIRSPSSVSRWSYLKHLRNMCFQHRIIIQRANSVESSRCLERGGQEARPDELPIIARGVPSRDAWLSRLQARLLRVNSFSLLWSIPSPAFVTRAATTPQQQGKILHEEKTTPLLWYRGVITLLNALPVNKAVQTASTSNENKSTWRTFSELSIDETSISAIVQWPFSCTCMWLYIVLVFAFAQTVAAVTLAWILVDEKSSAVMHGSTAAKHLNLRASCPSAPASSFSRHRYHHQRKFVELAQREGNPFTITRAEFRWVCTSSLADFKESWGVTRCNAVTGGLHQETETAVTIR